PLLPGAQGAAADEASPLPRRVDHRPAPRPVGLAHRHPQGRDRPRPRRHREAQSARGVDRGRGLGLRARARSTDASAVRARVHLDRLRAVHARDPCRRSRPRRALVVGDERAEGVRNPLRDRDRRARARTARADRRARVRLQGEAQEVALAEAQAVLSRAQDGAYRDRLASLQAAATEGEVAGEDAETLQELLEVGLQSGRLRALYGPGGERAALSTYRRLPSGAALSESAREVSEALRSLAGQELRSVSLDAVGPGAFTLTFAAGSAEIAVRLDRQGARLHSVGV